jgi:TonB family protein
MELPSFYVISSGSQFLKWLFLTLLVGSSLAAAFGQTYLAPTAVDAGEALFPSVGPTVALVSLLATVESDGRVSGTQIIDSVGNTLTGEPYPESLSGYVEDSIAAVTQWQFSPAIDAHFKRTQSVASITFVYDRIFGPEIILPIMKTIAPKAGDSVPPLPSFAFRAECPPNSLGIGTVVLKLQINEKGTISDIEVVKSIPSLDEPSVHAVRNWHFRPARYQDQPIRSTTSVAFVFRPPRRRR